MRDYLEWHKPYDDPDSRLSHRLRAVQAQLRETLDYHAEGARILSLCAGQGRDVIPVLAERRRTGATALLIELDERNAALAEQAARGAGLSNVQVRCADASLTDVVQEGVPADVVLACGIFGNISDEDVRHTINHLPSLCAASADVIWTRGRTREHDVTPRIRDWFGEAGFAEIAFVAPSDERLSFAVGTHRLVVPPASLRPGARLFTFRE